ncbi:MAG TPA: hypothetical protein VJP85_00595, partial [Candidatus Baltobacteraceae bacterium]|nr:hypothetical protein [Candidatus Baltobacteraceae bacterium]
MTSRYAVRIGSALALLAAIAFSQSPARADDRLALRLDGKTVVFTHVRNQGPARAIAADDPGLLAFLSKIGATLTWQPGERYVLFTTGEPVVVSFAVGDARYDVGPVKQTAPFAPFLLDGHPYVPFDELIHALDFAIKQNGSQAVLQPQLASLDLQASADGTKLVAHAGIPIDARITAESSSKLVVTFDGVGSMLPPTRVVGSSAVRRVDVRTLGTAAHPQTQVTLSLAPGTSHGAPGTDDQRDFTLTLGSAVAAAPAAAPVQATAPASPQPAPDETPEPSPAASTGPVQVTGVQTQPQNGSVVIRVDVSGNTAYEWHRLHPPD